MNKQLIRFAPLQTAKVLALLYFLASIPFVLFLLLVMPFTPAPGMGAGFLIAMPFLYALGGFIFTLIGTLFYNLAAKWAGGIEFTTVEQ